MRLLSVSKRFTTMSTIHDLVKTYFNFDHYSLFTIYDSRFTPSKAQPFSDCVNRFGLRLVIGPDQHLREQAHQE